MQLLLIILQNSASRLSSFFGSNLLIMEICLFHLNYLKTNQKLNKSNDGKCNSLATAYINITITIIDY
jgi:hypothetical protein